MSGFMTDMDARFLTDGTKVRLLAPLKYQDVLGRIWTVPTGFETDGASIPRELWSTVGSPLTGKYRRAAVVHDYLYATKPLTREECDHILLEAMMKDGEQKIHADIIYDGVRVGGWKRWNEDQPTNL